MTNTIMYRKEVDDRGALCGWPRLSEHNECGVFACVCARVMHECVFHITASHSVDVSCC